MLGRVETVGVFHSQSQVTVYSDLPTLPYHWEQKQVESDQFWGIYGSGNNLKSVLSMLSSSTWGTVHCFDESALSPSSNSTIFYWIISDVSQQLLYCRLITILLRFTSSKKTTHNNKLFIFCLFIHRVSLMSLEFKLSRCLSFPVSSLYVFVLFMWPTRNITSSCFLVSVPLFY